MIDRPPLCDDQQLRRMLRCNSDSDDSVEMLDHIEACQRCQHRLDELAAAESEWQKTTEILSSAARDDAVEGADIFDSAYQLPRIDPREPAWTQSMVRQLLSPASHPEMLGRIGRYDVERLIGSGGMGLVLKAYDTELNRPVAIKLLAPHLAANGSARKRFAREARAAAAVVDEHVVAIHNVEASEDPQQPPFLVMKYIAGGSLQQRLDRDGPLDVCQILRIGMQTAHGLAAAHAQGLIHRDVKPSNILLDEGVERALLTDFGLARAENEACLTRSGFHPGTPHYMSPEQVRGEAIDGRSDLFGLGCVLYALVTGHPPFRAETSYAVLRRITDDTARPIRELNPDIPDWLERMVTKLLSKSPADRFDSAEEVAELLESCLAHAQHPTSVPLPEAAAALSPKRNGRPPWFKVTAVTGFAFALIFAAVLIVLEWKTLKAKETHVLGTGKVVAFVPQERQQSVRAVALWISGNDAPLVQQGNHVRLQFEGWPAVQSAGSFGGEVITIDPTPDGAGKFRILVIADGNDAWPDERYLHEGVRAKGWVLTGSVASDVASAPSQEDVQAMQVNAAEAAAGFSSASHEIRSARRSTHDAFLSEVEARHGKQLSEAERRLWWRYWLPRLMDVLDETNDAETKRSVAISALGLSNALSEFDTSETLLRILIQLARDKESAAAWQAELDGIPERRRLQGLK